MTENEAINRIRYRIDTASDIVGKGVDGKAYEDMEIAIKALEEIQRYRAIGTVEECQQAVERQRAKKPIEYEDKYYACPVCDNVLMYKWEKYPSQLKDKKCGLPYCLSCGQAISWERDNE